MAPTLPEHLSDGVVVLRRADPADVDELTAAVRASLEELQPWMPWATPSYQRADSATFLATAWLGWNTRTSFEFSIRDAVDQRLLGMCGLNDLDAMNRRANLGYWVVSSEAGRGIATAATKLVARFGLDQLKLSRVRILNAVGNPGSGKVAQNAGFEREVVMRRRLVLHDVAHDATLWVLTD